ncbi:hypothetical protein [Pseudactinotalea terrae]|uniref:hypothetical protein n=1 Tax=Pseudactinotalea terrae TaxID=1743262 RepID=UPI0012E2350D|nr:hypothetical protein [Pseudactinotalea terrae]
MTTLFHTSPTTNREQILAQGLCARRPSEGPYADLAAGQPVGVYVGPAPDRRGVWAHDDPWDVWEVDTNGVPCQPDVLNPGSTVLLDDVAAARVRLVSTYSWLGAATAPGGPNR